MSKVVVNRLIVPIVPAMAAFAFAMVAHQRVMRGSEFGCGWIMNMICDVDEDKIYGK